MKNLRSFLIAFSFALCTLGSAQSQVQKGELKKGENFSFEISPGETQRFTLQMQKDQFAFLTLLQQGADVKISTYTPGGDEIESFDSPTGKEGFEFITLRSSQSGEYVIAVSPVDEQTTVGKYSLNFERLQPKAASTEEEVDELFSSWDRPGSPGAAVAIVKDGAVIYKNGYGMANLEYDIPVSPASVFHIASVSKQFTVFSILLLESEGRLSLEDDIRKYIPEVPKFGETITLRHLASHTSGLRDQWNLLAMAGWRLDDVITKEHVLKLVEKQQDLNFEPGEEYLYCNTGFTLLAEVVARVSGQSFAEFTRTRIFEPLEMNNTLFYDDHEKIVKNRAYSYYPEGGHFKKSVLSYANVGATSLFTTVEDLSLWAMNFSDPKVGDADILNTMNTPAVLNNGETFGGALGQFVGKYKGLNEIQHGGADAGYRSYLTRFPDEGVSVIVFSNDASFSSGGMAHKVADIYLKDRLQVEEITEPETAEATDEIVMVEQEILDNYVGEYELQPGLIMKVTTDAGKLYGTPTGQATRLFKALSENEFKVDGIDARVKFVSGGDGRVSLLQISQGGQTMDIQRVEPFNETVVDLSEFTGRFYSEELSTEYIFRVEDGKLLAGHSRLSDIDLEPVKKDVFKGSAWFFRQLEFLRNERGEITGCKVSSGRVRDLEFRKIKS